MISSQKVFAGRQDDGKSWHIEQFTDKGLAHFSYAIIADKKIILVDPQRNPQIYYDFAKANAATIIGVIETHPHADFASSHLQIHTEARAAIYTSSLTKPAYPFTPFDEGAVIHLTNDLILRSMYTPGHAPDAISAVLQERGKDIAVFSGDALLIGDVGRPDLRDYSNNVQAQRQRLAVMMYHTVHEKFARLADDVIVYPTHGAGSLCGKAIRDAPSSTIGYERRNNYAFAERREKEFVDLLLKDLPFIPKYFPYDVGLNVHGVKDFKKATAAVKILPDNYHPDADSLIIDARPAEVFKRSYLPNAINLQNAVKFETWLGSVVAPGSLFYLVAETKNELSRLIEKAAKIGYEPYIQGAFVCSGTGDKKFDAFDNNTFVPDNGKYTIIDVRTEKEFKEEPIFDSAINIPLQELSSRIADIPKGKPVLVNCASGYRSAAGSSLIKKYLPDQLVFDLGTNFIRYEKR